MWDGFLTIDMRYYSRVYMYFNILLKVLTPKYRTYLSDMGSTEFQPEA